MVTAADDARLAALEARVKDVQEGQRQILGRLDAFDARLDTMQHETNSRFDSTQRETNSRFDSLQHQINSRFDRLHIAIRTVGGGIIVMLMGLLIAQVIQGSG